MKLGLLPLLVGVSARSRDVLAGAVAEFLAGLATLRNAGRRRS